MRKAPAVDAEILTMMNTGTTFEVDALRNGWVRTAKKYTALMGGERSSQRGWALIDGANLGLGALLVRA